MKEPNPAYLSEKRPFKCVVRPRKHLIDRTYGLIKRAILPMKWQKIYVKTGQKNQDFKKDAKCLPEFLKVF